MANTSKKRKQTTPQNIFQVVSDMMSRSDDEEVEIRFQRGSEMSQVARIDRICFGASAWSEEKLCKRCPTAHWQASGAGKCVQIYVKPNLHL